MYVDIPVAPDANLYIQRNKKKDDPSFSHLESIYQIITPQETDKRYGKINPEYPSQWISYNTMPFVSQIPFYKPEQQQGDAQNIGWPNLDWNHEKDASQ
jgi:hypothetical protein